MFQDSSFSEIQTQQCNHENNVSIQKVNTSFGKVSRQQIGTLSIDAIKYPVYKGLNVVGRDRKCHIHLTHLTVSKKHAEIEADDKDTIFISDLQSSNGTVLNRKMLRPHKAYQLVSGNTVIFGEVQATFHLYNNDDHEFLAPGSFIQSNASLNSSVSTSDVTIIKHISTRTVNLQQSPSKKLISSTPKNSTKLLSQTADLTQASASPITQTQPLKTPTREKPQKMATRGSEEDIFGSPTSNPVSATTPPEKDLSPPNAEISQGSNENALKRPNVKDKNATLHTLEDTTRNEKRTTTSQTNEPPQKPGTSSINLECNYSGRRSKCTTQKGNDPQDIIVLENTENDTKGPAAKDETKEAPKESEIIPDSDEERELDDIFKDLPKFSIPNTLSNPASPVSIAGSETSEESAAKYTPRTLKFKSVLKSLQSSKIYSKDSDEEDKKLEEMGNRVLRVRSAYDKLQNDSMTEKAPETGDTVKKPVQEAAEDRKPKRQGKLKKVQEKAETESPRKSPAKRKSAVGLQELAVVLQPLKRGKSSTRTNREAAESQIEESQPSSVGPSKIARKSRRQRNEGEEKQEEEQKPEAKKRKTSGSRTKRAIAEINNEAVAEVSKTRGRAKKMKVDEKEEVQAEEKRNEIESSPVISRRSLSRVRPNESLNHTLNTSINRECKVLLNTSISSPRKSKLKILFTGIEASKWKSTLTKLGMIEGNDVATSSLLLTDKVRRTVKFLCALARGIPIVSIKWLEDSAKANSCLNWDDYILEDPEAEKKFGFTLRSSLKLASEKKLLEGFHIFLTPKIKAPPLADLKEMVKTAGGTVSVTAPRKWPEKAAIVTAEGDYENAKRFAMKAPKNVGVHSTEFVLSGILRQEIDLKNYTIKL